MTWIQPPLLLVSTFLVLGMSSEHIKPRSGSFEISEPSSNFLNGPGNEVTEHTSCHGMSSLLCLPLATQILTKMSLSTQGAFSNHALDPSVRWMAITCIKNGVDRYWRLGAPKSVETTYLARQSTPSSSCYHMLLSPLVLHTHILVP